MVLWLDELELSLRLDSELLELLLLDRLLLDCVLSVLADSVWVCELVELCVRLLVLALLVEALDALEPLWLLWLLLLPLDELWLLSVRLEVDELLELLELLDRLVTDSVSDSVLVELLLDELLLELLLVSSTFRIDSGAVSPLTNDKMDSLVVNRSSLGTPSTPPRVSVS